MEVIYNAATPSQLTETRAVHLLTENTPNGKKVQVLLEELRAEYGFKWETHLIDLDTDEQKKDWFLALNPNGMTPPLHAPISVTESSAILVYLQEQHDKDNIFGFSTSAERSQALQWLFFWHAAAPIRGQLSHFRSLKESHPHALNRLRTELLRIYSVLEDHLSGRHRGGVAREYLVGTGTGKYSIADIGTWPHVRGYRTASGFSDEEMASFPSLMAWIARIAARPAAREGISDKYSSADNPDAVLRGA
ncbi:glutathione S-transferase [Coniochaeta ligniaria NRRL 30616]|uniref:Glutathione S-transferase n=1 Tax=Coniochaeta ligniaria NRRL 30616 TaxID=1408157 RepID=A0A1J7JML6_9PEZI|nr:glutathione S-transferase [Coniochaeta ligniaria NRRL 30616]